MINGGVFTGRAIPWSESLEESAKQNKELPSKTVETGMEICQGSVTIATKDVKIDRAKNVTRAFSEIGLLQ